VLFFKKCDNIDAFFGVLSGRFNLIDVFSISVANIDFAFQFWN
jgi:hypothetical protein